MWQPRNKQESEIGVDTHIRKSAQGLPVKQKQLAKESPKLDTAPSKTREGPPHSLFCSYYSSFVPHYLVSPSNIYLPHDTSDHIWVIYGFFCLSHRTIYL